MKYYRYSKRDAVKNYFPMPNEIFSLGLSTNTVRKYVDHLREKQLISTEPTQVILKNGRKRNGNLRYTIRPIEEAVRYHYERQMIQLEDEVQRQKAPKRLAKYDRKSGKTKCEQSG